MHSVFNIVRIYFSFSIIFLFGGVGRGGGRSATS